MGNDPLVAHLPPGLAGGGQARAGVLNHGLDEHALFCARQRAVGRLRAGFAHDKKAGRREWVRALMVRAPDADAVVRKFPRQGAGVLTSMVESDGLVELGEDVTHVTPGETVDFLPLSEVDA
ncbi:MAG: hypothetical protein HUU30_11400 [Burkholderiaceae bacterium]|nr:hypothetical protein [Burkholderiaceae bacterium]